MGGPNALRHVEQSLAVAEKTGLDLKGQFEVTALIDDFAFGHAMRTRGIGRAQQTPKERFDAVIAYMEQLLETGEFPRLQAVAGDDIRGSFERVGELAHRSRALRARPPGRARRDRADAGPRQVNSVPLSHVTVRRPASFRRRP